jgi:ethanolamine utilization protein EutJ
MKLRETVNQRISKFAHSLTFTDHSSPPGPLYAGVDLGTAYIVTAVVDNRGTPVAGVVTRSRSTVRDGIVLDYVGALAILRDQVGTLHQAGFQIHLASAGYPPGISGRTVEIFGNVLRGAGLEVVKLIDEPSAASLVLENRDGAVVDIGGGTTGISVIRDGDVVYTADEPTGGIHLDLVLAGHFRIDVEQAERIKTDPARQPEVFPLVRPVFQKMATIVSYHLRDQPMEIIYLVGGTCSFPGIGEVLRAETGLEAALPVHPMLVTPLGIALSCLEGGRERSRDQ